MKWIGGWALMYLGPNHEEWVWQLWVWSWIGLAGTQCLLRWAYGRVQVMMG